MEGAILHFHVELFRLEVAIVLVGLRIEVVDFQAAKPSCKSHFWTLPSGNLLLVPRVPGSALLVFALPGSVCVLTAREVLNEGIDGTPVDFDRLHGSESAADSDGV